VPVPKYDDPNLIRTPGWYELGHGYFLTVTRNGGRIEVEWTRPGNLHIGRGPFAEEGSGWFIYLVSKTEIWMYPGGDQLDRWLLRANGLDISPRYCSDPNLPPVPKAVASHLPERIRKALKAKD
jgi:hypothetical protein